MSDSILIHRDTDVLTLTELGREFLLPERIRIQLDVAARKAPLDVGCFAYKLRRFESDHVQAAKPVQVDPGSLAPERRELIRNIVDYIYVSGMRDKSILTYFKKVKVVMDWCDQNGYSDWLHSVNQTGVAYVAYSDYLKHQILVARTLAPMTCATRQQTFQQLIEISFGADAAHVLHLAPAISVSRAPL